MTGPILDERKLRGSLGALVRRRAYWTYDLCFNRGLVRTQYQDLQEIAESPSAGRERVARYLEDLLSHAAATTAFYRPYAGTPLVELPVVDKILYRQSYDSFLSSAYRHTTLHTQSTSGSTGIPFSVPQNTQKRNRVIAELKLYAHYAGHESHEKMIYLRIVNPRTRKSWLTCFKENIWRIDTSSLGNESLESVRQTIKHAGAVTLFAYGSTFDALAQYLADAGDTSADFKVRAVISGGEALYEHTRQRLKDIFECPVTSRYSNEEMGVLAHDSDVDRGYDLNWGSYHFESLKLHSDDLAADNEPGRIVITDLFNFAFPMIRYDTGDLGILDRRSEGEWPKLRELYGKRRDVIYDTRGHAISPAVIPSALWGLEGVKQFQFIQETRSDYRFRLNGVENPTIEERIKYLKTLLGDDANIVAEYVDEIPVLASHKRQYTVCKIEHRQAK